jgi:hypothetical protein
MRALLLTLLFALGLGTGPALSQSAYATPLSLDERGWPTGSEASAVADAAIAAWLAREPLLAADFAGLDAAAVCAALPSLVQNPPPPEGTRVLLDERRDWLESSEAGLRTFTYAAVRPGDQLDVVQVDLLLTADGFAVDRVGFRSSTALTGMRAWLQTPAASWVFGLLTVLVLVQLALPRSPLRRAWLTTRATLERHRRTVIGTMVLLSSVFMVGVGTGAALPPECDEGVFAMVNEAVGRLGATEAYGSGNVARAAALTFYQNFVVVSFSLHFLLAMLLGFPSYLVAIPQFFVLGIPFGMLSGLTWWGAVPLVVLIVIELAAYFLVISGGGIALRSVIRRGWRGYREGVRAAASLLLPAALLLLAGAWYEAILLIGL